MALTLNPYSLMYQTVFFENQQVPLKEDLLQTLQPFFYRGAGAEVKKPVATVVTAATPTTHTTAVKERVPVPVKEPLKKPQKNTLFWSIYHAIHGPPLYAETYDINMELQERHKIADCFRENTRCLKDRRHRMTNADVDEVVSNLLTLSARKTFYTTCFGDIMTDLSQVVVYAQYYKKNIDICLPDRRVKVSFVYDETADKITLLYDPLSNLFLFAEDAMAVDVFLQMENIKASLKTLSQYKIGELVEIGQQLGITSPPKKKGELYQRILEHCHGLTSSSSSSSSL